MTKGGRITGHLALGRGMGTSPALALIRKAASSRSPYTCTGQVRVVQHYGVPPPVTLPRLPSMGKPDPDDGNEGH